MLHNSAASELSATALSRQCIFTVSRIAYSVSPCSHYSIRSHEPLHFCEFSPVSRVSTFAHRAYTHRMLQKEVIRVLGAHFRPRLRNCLAQQLLDSATEATQRADELQPDFDLAKNSVQALNTVRFQFGGETRSVDPGVLLVDTVLLSEDQTEHLRSLISDFNPIGTGFTVIIDSGASTSLSYDEADFDEILPLERPMHLTGIGKGLEIKGQGYVRWTLIDDNGNSIPMKVHALYCPGSKVKILSPQDYFVSEEGEKGAMTLNARRTVLHLRDGQLSVNHHPIRRLPIIRATRTPSPEAFTAGICVSTENNANLTKKQQRALLYHWKLGHADFRTIADLSSNGTISPTDLRASCNGLKCEACQLAKARKRPVPKRADVKVDPQPDNMGKIRENDLVPGDMVSVDQYSVTVRGRLIKSKGTGKTSYSGGTIFYDHASGYIKVSHQTTLGAADTVKSKEKFEREAYQNGRTIKSYHSDNGVFTAKSFTEAIEAKNQLLRLSGVGAHHQNGCAERAIGIIFEKARTMMIHSALKWPEETDVSLWPMAVDYAVYLHNHLPKRSPHVSPEEIFSGTKCDGSLLRAARVWGCPAYVLDAKMQDGLKLPKWQPRARRGRFLGMSSAHSSTVGMILNLSTKRISPQFHVIYDDLYQTVYAPELQQPATWPELFRYNRVRHTSEDFTLSGEWNPTSEGEDEDEPARPATKSVTFDLSDEPTSIKLPSSSSQSQQNKPLHPTISGRKPTPTRLDFQHENVVNVPAVSQDAQQQPPSPVDELATIQGDVGVATAGPGVPTKCSSSTSVKDGPPKSVVGELRRSKRVNRGIPARRYGYEEHGYTLALMPLPSLSELTREVDELSVYYNSYRKLHTDADSGVLECDHELAFAAKSSDPDTLSYRQARTAPDWEEFREAGLKEFTELSSKHMWDVIKRGDVPKGKRILPSTLVMKRKRYPDGRLRKYKARFCVWGDLQVKGSDYFETYAPVVQMSTVRLMLTLATKHKFKTRQVDYSNAFVQADLDTDVYVRMPPGVVMSDGTEDESVLKLNKSLYGLKQAPLKWYEKLRDSLLERGFKQSKQDPCLFLMKNLVAVVWVDDVLFFSRNDKKIDEMISSLREDFELTEEGTVESFLGLTIIHHEDGSIEFLQTGLIDRVILECGLSDCNPTETPALKQALGPDGNPRVKAWNYASVVGMLLYIAGNSRPDIAFAVHQVARFTHNPTNKHEQAVTMIVRYLKGTRDRGLVYKPSNESRLDAYCDADFAGLYGVEDDADPISVKSRSGFVIMYDGCPVVWKSKLQSLIALSTLEAEYISLSQCMRELIPLRRVLGDIAGAFNLDIKVSLAHSKVFEDNDGALTLANAPQMTPRTKHIALRYHHFREEVRAGRVHVLPIASIDQIADIFTKGLKNNFANLRMKLMGW